MSVIVNMLVKKNEQLYKNISDLLGLYSYTKNKIHIKPYVIIRD
jgi:hypothetical protein